jgi:Domain of unknown function (DUF5117)/Domain of unknown function (DUF5118)
MSARALTVAMTLMLGLPVTVEAMSLREVAGRKPGSDDPVVTREGLFTVHTACDRLLFEIPDSVYGKDMLFNTEFAAVSGGANMVAPGTLVDNHVVRWVRLGNEVNLQVEQYEIAAGQGEHIERAVEATTLPTLLRTFEIVGRGLRGEAIIDITPLFVTDPPSGFALGFMKHFGTQQIDPKRSYIDSVKAFPRNVGIRFYQTWVADRSELLGRVQEAEESVIDSLGFVFYTNF